MRQTWAFALVMVAIGIIVGCGVTHGYDLQRAHDFGRAPVVVGNVLYPVDDGLTIDIPWYVWAKVIVTCLIAMVLMVPIMSAWCGWFARIDYMRKLAWQREVERQEREAADADKDGKS
jgi:hypothetical protein